MNTYLYRGIALTLTSFALAASLSACQRPEADKTVGQKIDSAAARAQQQAGEVKADAKQAAATATEKVKGTASDVAITTEVNARLAKDTQLSAVRINVDTTEGQVVLNGSAPDAASRERARTLAVGVDGVRGVDNRLIVSAKN